MTEYSSWFAELTGFAPGPAGAVALIDRPTPVQEIEQLEQGDNQQDGEPLSISQWKTIGFHAAEVRNTVADIAAARGLPDERIHILELAARWHDIGKSRPALQGKIRDAADRPRPARNDLAKAPDSARLRRPRVAADPSFTLWLVSEQLCGLT